MFNWCKKQIFLDSELSNAWHGNDFFRLIFQLQGKIFRQEKNRKTLRFMLNGKSYFAKLHEGVGWKEIFKNILQCRWPVIGAQQEWRAIQRFKQLGVPTMNLMGYGQRGWNPAHLQSFVITEELVNTISLEDFCRNWLTHPPTLLLKRKLIAVLAKIARTLHQHGINHRDFYICHFLLLLSAGQEKISPDAITLYVIDLHRAQIRKRTPQRWVIKDIAGLYFSSFDLGLKKRDLWCFMRHYSAKPLAECFAEENNFWQQVINRATKLYAKERPDV